jgi:undecaprenyl-diphosphatase
MGTLAAVIVFCRRELLAMLRPGSQSLWRLVVPATVITAAAGLSLEDLVASALSTPVWIGAGLFVNALLMGVLAPRDDRRLSRSLAQGTVMDGVVLGALQSLSLVPSVSRSASTIVAALWLGYARRDAVRVAFLVSVPAVAGAVSLSLMRGSGQAALHAPGMTAGLLSAFLVGLLALRFLTLHVDARSLRAFALYCLLLGTVVILVG